MMKQSGKPVPWFHYGPEAKQITERTAAFCARTDLSRRQRLRWCMEI